MNEMIEGWVVLETLNYEHQAEIIRARLESAGIESMIFSQKDHVNVLYVGDLSEIKILVKQDDLAKAQEVLKDLELPEMEIPEDADVGEPIDGEDFEYEEDLEEDQAFEEDEECEDDVEDEEEDNTKEK